MNTGRIIGDYTAGGISGHLEGRNISQCCNLADVSARKYSGGIIGYGYGAYYNYGRPAYFFSIIDNCFNTGTISAENAGGIAGAFSGFSNYLREYSKLSFCYNVGTVQSEKNSGEIIGLGALQSNSRDKIAEIKNCVYLDGKNPDATYHQGTGYSSEELQTAGAYDSFDFAEIWGWDDTNRYPYAILKRVGLPQAACEHNYKLTSDTATCTEAGTATYTCSECGERYTEASPAKGHTPGDAVRENEVAATCTEEGSYDEVIRCSVCEAIISSEHKTIDMLGHDFSGNREFCANGCGTKNPDYIPPHRPPYKPPHVMQPDPTPTKPEKPKNPFKDVSEKDYFYDAVLWAVEKEIASGMQTGLFDAEKACTRAEMVTFLWRAAGKPEPTTRTQPFADVAESAYYSKAVVWAVEQGIAKGTSSTTFSPDATCTRGQAAAFLYRYAGSPAVSGTIRFNDVKEADYYYDAVRWAVSENITLGTSASAFSPDALCTRGQIVTFLYRYLEL